VTPKTQFIKKVGKPHFIKIKNYCSVRNTIKGMKRQATDWEEVFANPLTKDLYSEHREIFENSAVTK